jgi:hypothetical protein
MATMWCVYGFTALSLMPVLEPKWQTTLLYVSNCIQLVALPIIMVGNSLLGEAADRRAEQDHQTIMRTLAELHTVHMELHGKLENGIGHEGLNGLGG